MSQPFQSVSNLFSLSDEKAMVNVQESGDPKAFALLVHRWEKPIQRLCIRMIGDEHKGQDLAQETFARLFQKRASYRPTAKFSTYLWRVALNICYDELRRKKSRPEASEAPDERDSRATDDFNPSQWTARREEAEMVREALEKLPETYRTVLILRHYEDLKLREISEILDLPVGTVSSRMAEALNRLSRHLLPRLSKQRSSATPLSPQDSPIDSPISSAHISS